MCIATPMEIIECMPDNKALAESNGNRLVIDTRLIEGARVGEFVLIHAGCAIERVDKGAAADILTLIEEVAAYERESHAPPV